MSNFIVWLRSPKPNRMSEPERWSRMQSMVVCLPWWCDSVAGARGKRHMFQRHSNVCLTNQKSCSASKWFSSSQELWSRSSASGSSLPQALQQEGGTRLEVEIPRRSNIHTPSSSVPAQPRPTVKKWVGWTKSYTCFDCTFTDWAIGCCICEGRTGLEAFFWAPCYQEPEQGHWTNWDPHQRIIAMRRGSAAVFVTHRG